MDILFSSQYIVRSSHGKVVYQIAALYFRFKNLINTFQGRICSNISVVNISHKSRGDHTQKALRKTKLISTFYSTYLPQKCHANAILIQLCNMRKLEQTFVSLCHEDFCWLFYLEPGFYP